MYNYNGYDYGSSVNTGLAVLGGLAVFLILIGIAVAVLLIVSYWKVFKKAGKNGWEAIVPYYNAWILNEISGAHWIWFIVAIAASAGLTGAGSVTSVCGVLVAVTDLIVSINLAKKFGKSTGFGVLCAILPVVGYPILAFGQAEYNAETVVPLHGIFDRDFAKNNVKPVKKATNECPKCHEKITSKMNNCPNCGSKLK